MGQPEGHRIAVGLHENGYFVALAGAMLGSQAAPLIAALFGMSLGGNDGLTRFLFAAITFPLSFSGSQLIGCFLALWLCGFAGAAGTTIWLAVLLAVAGIMAIFVGYGYWMFEIAAFYPMLARRIWIWRAPAGSIRRVSTVDERPSHGG